MKKIFLFLFYNFVKTIVRIAYFIYFDKITYINGETLRRCKPCIIASNHPNCLIDVFLVGKQSNRIVHFLANIGLFKPPFWEWFFNTFYAIPIQRKMDTGGKRLNNADAFNRCDEFLIGGGALYIAPQGTSWVERKLGKIKTGTARIALSAASKQKFETELEIIPVGVTYKDPLAFRKSAVINVGEPIKIADYKERYEENNREAILALTKNLEDGMGALVIDAVTDERDALLQKQELILNGDYPKSLLHEIPRTKKLLKSINELEAKDADKFKSLETTTNVYFQKLEEQNLSDEAVYQQRKFSKVVGAIKYLLGLPFFLFGYLNNILGFGIPVFIKNRIKIYKGFCSSIKVMAGTLFVPIFYTIQIFIVHKVFHTPLITWGYAFSLLPVGLFAWHYKENFKDFSKAWKLASNKTLSTNLIEQRAQLDTTLQSLLHN